MTETMYDCYMSQFHCLSRLMDNRKELLSGFEEFLAKTNPDRIYLVGSGTSFNACAAAAKYMEHQLKLEIFVAPPTTLPPIRGERPLVIAVSQSGKSTNTRNVVKQLVSNGIPVVTLTDPKNTPVSNEASFAMHLHGPGRLAATWRLHP